MAKRSRVVKPGLNGKEVMKQQSSEYKVLRSPAVTSKDHFKNLGFLGGCITVMYVSDRKTKFRVKSLYDLGRSWFKEEVTKKDKVLLLCHMSSDDNEAKGYLKEFIELAKAAIVLTRMCRKKRKMVQKQAFSTSAPRCGKKKFVPKIRSLNDILRAIDQEDVNSNPCLNM